MTHSYIAIDLGAGSGRVILGTLDADERLRTTVLHRFSNETVPVLGHLHWDISALYRNMIHGMHICADKHTTSPESIGVDSWGVDFGLFDAAGSILGEPRTYRDHRTDGMIEAFSRLMPAEELYRRTGIQIMAINTVFQLLSMTRCADPQLTAAKHLLFVPDIFNHLFTGIMKSEFTFATTSALYNPIQKAWDNEICRTIGIDKGIMQDVVQPGSIIGPLVPSVAAETGLDRVPVVAVGCHDTASAVAAMPATTADAAYISSGTWSLMGIESSSPIITRESHAANFTNEGGVGGTFRFLKNIMGMWLLQECRRQWSKEGGQLSYDELDGMAQSAAPFLSLIDPDRPMFLSPPDMVGAIEKFCRDSGQPTPASKGAFVRCIYESLALDYRFTLERIAVLSDRTVKCIHIIGGGSQNTLLNQLTANATGVPVAAGPVEATAIGNILVQAMAQGRVKSVEELRAIVRDSFEVAMYEPEIDGTRWEKAYNRFIAFKRY